MIDLHQHSFLRDVISRATPPLLEAWERVRANPGHEEATRRENRRRATAAQRYDHEILRRATGLTSAIATARNALRLLSLAPSTGGLKRAGLSRDAWVDYHFGVFTVTVAGIPDIGLVLTGTVCRLGLPPRLYSLDLVTHHEAISGTPIATALKNLRKAALPAIDRRHGHVHRGEFADISDIGTDDFLTHVKMLTWLEGTGAPPLEPGFLRQAWREAVKEIVPALESQLTEVETKASDLLDVLTERFRQTSDALHRIAKIAAEPMPPAP